MKLTNNYANMDRKEAFRYNDANPCLFSELPPPVRKTKKEYKLK